MSTVVTSQITAIGPSAVMPNDPLIILFDQTATPALKNVAVIQQFAQPKLMSKLVLAEGDQIAFDDQNYTVAYVGNVANQNLQTIGHITLLFSPVPASDRLGNGVYLTATTKPTIHVGSQIAYYTEH